jgi:hypothetical protein
MACRRQSGGENEWGADPPASTEEHCAASMKELNARQKSMVRRQVESDVRAIHARYHEYRAQVSTAATYGAFHQAV